MHFQLRCFAAATEKELALYLTDGFELFVLTLI